MVKYRLFLCRLVRQHVLMSNVVQTCTKTNTASSHHLPFDSSFPSTSFSFSPLSSHFPPFPFPSLHPLFSFPLSSLPICSYSSFSSIFLSCSPLHLASELNRFQKHTQTHTHTTNLWPSRILSGTTRVSCIRKVKPIWTYWIKR